MKNVKGNVLFWSLSVSLGGLLFGFDTAVISGGEQAIQKLWSLSNFMVGQMVAMGLYGTIVGALFGGIPAEKYGRKWTLLIIGIFFLICAIGSAMAPDVYTLMFFRFIGGLGVGASSVVAPMYISEIAPQEKRGQLTALFQFNLVLGILLAYLSNYLIGNTGEQSWRVMLGIMAIPSIAFIISLFFIPESPRWLITVKKKIEEARAILHIIDPTTVEASMAAIQAPTSGDGSSFKQFISGKFNFSILLAFLFAFFNQLSGINAVIYYAPRILEETGLGAQTALLSTAGIGLVNLIFTMLGLRMIDRFGRKYLMYIGSLGYIISLSAISIAFFLGKGSALVPILLFMFIASHAIGQGAVIWVFISEIFPNRVRSWGASLGSSTHWLFAALIAGLFPFFNEKLGGGIIFAFFAVMMVLQLLFVWKIMPETKGISLEDLEKKLTKS
ncbi:MAG: sugar porter family MFS transporter [Saprospiraceae bacterium]|nr:sugar porter family MFS transporter [Saprospiraceae bacterium]MBK8777285.1 sugar porter family MFS transporter [Saprospiraceae bacterium]